MASTAVDRNDYTEWVRRYDTLTEIDQEKIKSRIASFQAKPLISVVMPVYNPPIGCLIKLFSRFASSFIRIGNCVLLMMHPLTRPCWKC